jgi:uncharacterized protein YmfQ (DUF2313 family)
VTSSLGFTLLTEPVAGPPVFASSPDLDAVTKRFQAAAIALLPPGRALSKEPDSNLGVLIEALMVEFARVQLEADAMRSNGVPAQAVDYLDEWEDALGLPGDVDAPPTTTDDRIAAIVAKLRGRKGHSQLTYEATAAVLGYPDVEFERFAPFEVGLSAVGDALTSDEWAHVVRIHVLVGDQAADSALISMFVNELRRQHAYLDIILEGPMGAERKPYVNYFNAQALSAHIDGAPFDIRYAGHVSIVAEITNGLGAAPTDTPVGAWELHVSGDGTNWVKDTEASYVTELAKIAPNGNNIVRAVSKLTNVGTMFGRFRYQRTSGGAVDAKVTAHVFTW